MRLTKTGMRIPKVPVESLQLRRTMKQEIDFSMNQ